jgi:hypothetical protein
MEKLENSDYSITVRHCVLYPELEYDTVQITVPGDPVLVKTLKLGTIQYSTVPIVDYNTVQYSTVPRE